MSCDGQWMGMTGWKLWETAEVIRSSNWMPTAQPLDGFTGRETSLCRWHLSGPLSTSRVGLGMVGPPSPLFIYSKYIFLISVSSAGQTGLISQSDRDILSFATKSIEQNRGRMWIFIKESRSAGSEAPPVSWIDTCCVLLITLNDAVPSKPYHMHLTSVQLSL